MGQETGFIALEVGIAGGAEQIIIPERKCDLEELCQNLKESFKRGKRSSIIVVAEGNQIEDTINIAKYVEMRLKAGMQSMYAWAYTAGRITVVYRQDTGQQPWNSCGRRPAER